MKTVFGLLAAVTLLLALDAPVTKTEAVAAGAGCAARCDAWCAKTPNIKRLRPAAPGARPIIADKLDSVS